VGGEREGDGAGGWGIGGRFSEGMGFGGWSCWGSLLGGCADAGKCSIRLGRACGWGMVLAGGLYTR